MNLKNNSISPHRPGPPSEKDLLKIYNNFIKEEVSIRNLADFSQLIRFDPRLGEYFYNFLEKNWPKINPTELNQELLKTYCPATIMVLLEQLILFQKNKSLILWKKCVQNQIPKARNELYFIGLWKPGSRFLYEEAELSTTPYLKWGFLGNETFKTKQALTTTLLPKKTRKSILKKMFKTQSRITAKEYQAHLKNLISIRQAERDLNAFSKQNKKFKKRGNTKGRFYQFS